MFCQGDGSFTESLGTNILRPHAKLLLASILFVESVEGQCLLTVWRVEKNRRILEQIGSLVENERCLQFLLPMAPRDNGNDFVLICQLSDMGKARLNSKKTRICLIYCAFLSSFEALPR